MNQNGLPVYYGTYESEPSDKPGLLGTYQKDGDLVIFTPRFPFTQGKSYTAFNKSSEAHKTFEVPITNTTLANEVKHFYPSDDEVPANLLKFYIEFEKPMKPGQAYQNIILIKDSKDTVSAPFLEFEQELWNKEQKLLTIWFDPGRIKRDLSPNQLLGNPLEINSQYELIIKKSWKDIYGQTLPSDFIKRFSAVDFDRKKPNEQNWKIDYPTRNSKEILSIQFHETMDYGTLLNGFQIEKDGELIETEFIITELEKSIQIKPQLPWKSGDYKIYINVNLEDLAGNNLNRLFDTDLSESISGKKEREEIVIGFSME